jgi:hypothetical protein
VGAVERYNIQEGDVEACAATTPRRLSRGISLPGGTAVNQRASVRLEAGHGEERADYRSTPFHRPGGEHSSIAVTRRTACGRGLRIVASLGGLTSLLFSSCSDQARGAAGVVWKCEMERVRTAFGARRSCAVLTDRETWGCCVCRGPEARLARKRPWHREHVHLDRGRRYYSSWVHDM